MATGRPAEGRTSFARETVARPATSLRVTAVSNKEGRRHGLHRHHDRRGRDMFRSNHQRPTVHLRRCFVVGTLTFGLTAGGMGAAALPTVVGSAAHNGAGRVCRWPLCYGDPIHPLGGPYPAAVV